jgi:uncharacterized SAM-binding protein YcdF (DUF218 family)
MKALILLALLGVLWFVSSRRWRRWLIQPLVVPIIAYLVACSPVGVDLMTQSLTLSLPADSGDRVSAIVVLGRGEVLRDRRAEIARDLWNENRAPRIFASGMLDAKSVIQFLKESGIPGQILSGEECSQNTEENGLYTAAILYPQGIRKILLVTDSPHLLRSFLIFRNFGFAVTPYSSPLPAEWSFRQQAYIIFREYFALAAYALTHRFHERTPAELEHPPAEVSGKIISWNCLVRGTSRM